MLAPSPKSFWVRVTTLRPPRLSEVRGVPPPPLGGAFSSGTFVEAFEVSERGEEEDCSDPA